MLAALVWGAAAMSLMAEGRPLPERPPLPVHDLAGLLETNVERRLALRLVELERAHGIELVVLTLPTRRAYAAGISDEIFAKTLFAHWRIGGGGPANRGILFLILREDRFARIELGSYYADDFDAIAQAAMSDAILPAFRADAYERGILDGTRVITTQIALGTRPERAAWTPYAIAAAVLGVTSLFMIPVIQRALRRRARRRRRCPRCNMRALRVQDQVARAPTLERVGSGNLHWQCYHCNWSDVEHYTFGVPLKGGSGTGLGKRGRPFGGSLGGGGASGGGSSDGGASGRW